MCVEGDVKITQKDRFLRWRDATKSIRSSHSVRAAEDDGSGFMYALINVVRPRGVRMSKACQRLCWS